MMGEWFITTTNGTVNRDVFIDHDSDDERDFIVSLGDDPVGAGVVIGVTAGIVAAFAAVLIGLVGKVLEWSRATD